MNEDTLQYYPTPCALAERAWAKFQQQDISRLLEPSAGTGELVAPRLSGRHSRERTFEWDAVELDPRHHARLKELGARVVGYDFLNQGSCAIYSHILMNPPFAQGARHVVHAWNTLYDGEIVAILNAETLRNAHSAERQMLARLVSLHGSVEFIEGAFKGPDAQRSADVDVALVHLVKRADSEDILGDVTGSLKKDGAAAGEFAWRAPNELALPTGFVETTVLNFDAAVQAAREEAVARTRAAHYQARLGLTLEQLQQKEADAELRKAVPAGEQVRDQFARAYAELRNAAWTQILRSTHVLSRLSSKAQKRVESQFEDIRALEFTCANVYGFLNGLVQSAGAIQMEMVCDVFDAITRYHSDNVVYYMGWKSNDRHRSAGMRLKTTRFILPGERDSSWRSTASFELRQMLTDFDKVFAMLDGKQMPAIGLASLFDTPESFKRLKHGERLSSDYFDVRFYRGVGTVHFFPRRKDIVERLNRVVGQHRQWLPPSMEQASSDFRKQYEQAERLRAEVEREFTERARKNSNWQARHLHGLTSTSEDVAREANAAMADALESVLDEHGIHPFAGIEAKPNADTLLLTAA
jgi:hypothetical protein